MNIFKYFLTICLFLAATATFAQHSGTTGQLSWEYNLTDYTLTISGNGRMGNYYDPATSPWRHLRDSVQVINIETGAITIGLWAFDNFTALTSVIIPSSVTRIESGAFSASTALQSITIPNSVKTIGGYAFQGSALTSITIPNSVNTIGNSAFVLCTSLAELNIGNMVRTIGNSAFYGCSALTEVILTNSVTAIGTSAFYGCTSLTKVTIPNLLTEIGAGAFAECTALTEVINHAETPQTVNSNVFQNVTQSACTLYVPAASVALYQAADVWKDFGTILAIGGAGVDDILSKNINIYPNPVRNELNIENGELNIEKVEIMDLSGKIVSTFNYSENKINVSTLSAGIYFIKINTDKGVVAEKFVKE